MLLKEACIRSYAEALFAQKAGADRIELCENLAMGGTTPSFGAIKTCVEQLTIPTFVMIRPRGGDFRYTQAELEIMKTDIDICKQLNVPAVVFGLLTKEGEIDELNTKMLIERARPMQVTFHKAFDDVRDPLKGIESLIQLGVDRILTSGTKSTAIEGAPILNQLIEKANGRITIVAAGKITKDNLFSLNQLIHTNEFHGKKIV
ncbi:copper homeostasis protein CutC [uncultured Sunxiuqinia sp.]|uniref:copper homeostasis protein CutC n=1 Tax=uncultured Sunxiuqinia sp. TaxID=1573825 RepID=UPI002AA7FFFB|nr:copper homeostasis protein CutC [uncultured Sunxiuqinia sp.]